MGAASSVQAPQGLPPRLDGATCRSVLRDRFDQKAFDALKGKDGCVARADLESEWAQARGGRPADTDAGAAEG